MIYTHQEFIEMSKFSIESIYQKMRGTNELIYWEKFIWNILAIPKHKLVGWLTMHQRLRKVDKSVSWVLLILIGDVL